MTTKIGSTLIAGLALMLAAPSFALADIHAEKVTSLLLRDGNNAGPYEMDAQGRDIPNDDYYPGVEQAQMMQLNTGEVLVFGMASYDLNGAPVNDRVQMMCASVLIDAQAGPVMQSMQYVTNNDGNRNRNAHHPRLTKIFDGEAVAVTYNYAPDNRARAYTTVFGPNCAQISDRKQIMAKNNDDCSETNGETPEIVVEQTATKARLVSFHGCNGNGQDDAWVAGTSITKNADGSFTVSKDWDFSIEANEERSRGTMLPTSEPNLAVACWTAGNTQPPNKGVRCGGIDTAEGTATGDRLLWRQYVERKEGELYRTQIRSAPILDAAGAPTNQAYIEYQELTKRRRNDRGAVSRKASVIQFSREGLDVLAVPQYDIAQAVDVTHGAICSTQFGVEGQTVSAMFTLSGSLNGSTGTLSTAQTVMWDNAARKLINDRQLPLNSTIDTGWLSNIYGQNPENQGRNYTRCVAGIANPHYGVAGAWNSEIKEFVGIVAASRRMDVSTGLPEQKLATELVLVPTVVAPETPRDPDPIDPADPADPVDPSNPDPNFPDDGNNGGSTLGGCSVNGSAPAGGLIAMLGLAFLFVTRRRR
jgi:MYXO-CTERM domain-containing protein